MFDFSSQQTDNALKAQWMIVRKRDDSPTEVYLLTDLGIEELTLYDHLSEQWNECFLTAIMHGPGKGGPLVVRKDAQQELPLWAGPFERAVAWVDDNHPNAKGGNRKNLIQAHLAGIIKEQARPPLPACMCNVDHTITCIVHPHVIWVQEQDSQQSAESDKKNNE